MSEQKLVSPLLDGFIMGNPMSEHDGITCHPAMREGSDDKYIVKIISVPASQVQLDALLLTGAYKDTAAALDYFTAEAENIAKEVDILQRISKLDGFLAYEGCQIAAKDNGLGNQVYLLGSYKRSLERHIRRSRMTHLEAVNLGLDLCQALAICRRAGYLYVNLKPSNVFISKNREYRIGDLGFVSMDSLKYTSLPGKYHSPYSPPESKDPLKNLDLTYDTYSAGMILYQVFNDGALPNPAPDRTKACLPPVNADYEISAIIMKAIAPDPADRWQDPMEMGHALVTYMQRNTVNNTPLAPQTELITDPDAPALVREASTQTKILPSIRDISAASETKPVSEETVAIPVAVTAAAVAVAEMSEPDPVPAPAEEPAAPPPAEEPQAVTPQDREAAIAEEISSLFTEGNSPALPDEPIIANVPAPAPVMEEDDGFSLEGMLNDEIIDDGTYPVDDFIEDVPELRGERRGRGSFVKKIIGIIAVILVLALLAVGGLWYYQNLYLQEIEQLDVVGSMDALTVKISTNSTASFNISCSDTYGNMETKPAVNGEAEFTNLLPNSQYKITVEIEGFHKLTGQTSTVFNTAAQTNVVSFTAIAGPEDGSVLLNLVVDGTEPDSWNMVYSAPGEEEQMHTFSGHSVTIKELSVGKTYTFTLQDPEESILTGNSSVEFTSTELIMADNLQIISCSDGNLKVQWSTPEGTTIDSWTVRCYNDGDYEQIQENVIGTEATFTEVDTTRAYTVEVTAAGMTQPIRTSITSNPITVTEFSVAEGEDGDIQVSWQYEGKSPVGGWLLMYKVDKAEKATVVKCDDTKASFSPRIPNAAYHFEIQAADSTSIFSNQHTFHTQQAPSFDYDDVTSDKVTATLFVTPEEENWLFENLDDEKFSSSFAAGESISIGLYSSVRFWLNDLDINALYVIRDAEGNVRSDLTTEETLSWKDLWYDGNTCYAELDMAVAPAEAGSYTLEIYFNHYYLTSASFTIQ